MTLTQRKVEYGLPQLDLEQTAEHDGGASVGKAFEHSEAGGVLRLVGEQRLGDYVSVENHSFGWLPVRCVERKHAAWQRGTTSLGHSSASPGRA